MNAINLNNADYYITGTTVWDDGRQREFDDYRRDPIVCPHVHRYGPEVLVNDLPNGRGKLPGGSIGYTNTFLTCVKLTAAEHEVEHARTEEHCARMLEELDRRR
jgi:hypothetical protein